MLIAPARFTASAGDTPATGRMTRRTAWFAAHRGDRIIGDSSSGHA
jgi:hypothetical protein